MQIALQNKGLSVDRTAIKIEAVRLYFEEKRDHILKEAIDHATKKSEDYDVQQKDEIVVKNDR